MRKIDGDTGRYYLPAKFQSSMALSMHILYLFMIVFFTIAIVFVPEYKSPTAKDIFLVICAGFLVIFSIINWLYFGVFRLGTVEIDNYGIHIRTLSVKKSIRWQNIKYMEITNGPTVKNVSSKVLQIILIEGDGSESAWERLNAKLTGNCFTYNIPLSSFSDVPWDVFMRTVNGIFDSISVPTDVIEEDVYPEDEI